MSVSFQQTESCVARVARLGSRITRRNVADVENLPGRDRANISGVKRDYREGCPAACDKLDLEALAGIVHVHNRADVAALETVIGQRSYQDYRIVLIHFQGFHRDKP